MSERDPSGVFGKSSQSAIKESKMSERDSSGSFGKSSQLSVSPKKKTMPERDSSNVFGKSSQSLMKESKMTERNTSGASGKRLRSWALKKTSQLPAGWKPTNELRSSCVERFTGKDVIDTKTKKLLRDWACWLHLLMLIVYILAIYFLSELLARKIFETGDPEALDVDKGFLARGIRMDVDEVHGSRATASSNFNSFSFDMLFFGLMLFCMRLLDEYTAYTVDPLEIGTMTKAGLVEVAKLGYDNIREVLAKYFEKSNETSMEEMYSNWALKIVKLYEEELEIGAYIKLTYDAPMASKLLELSGSRIWTCVAYVLMAVQLFTISFIDEIEGDDGPTFEKIVSVRADEGVATVICAICSILLTIDATARVFGYLCRPKIIGNASRYARIFYFILALLNLVNCGVQVFLHMTFNRIILLIVWMPLFRGNKTRELLQISLKVTAQAMGLITNVFWFIWCAIAIGYPALCTTKTGATGSFRDTFYALGTAIMIGEGWPDGFYWATGTYPAMWFFYAVFIMGGCLYVISAVLSVFEFEFDQYFELESTRQAIGAQVNHVAAFACICEDPAGTIPWKDFDKLLEDNYNMAPEAHKELKHLYVEPEGVDILSWTKIFHHLEINEIVDEKECDWAWIDAWKFHVGLEFLCLMQVIISGLVAHDQEGGKEHEKVLMDTKWCILAMIIFFVHFAHFVIRLLCYAEDTRFWTSKNGMNTLEFSFNMDLLIWICVILGFLHIGLDLIRGSERYPIKKRQIFRTWQVQAVFAATTMRIFTFNNPMFHMITVSIFAASPMFPILICLIFQTSCALSFGCRKIGVSYELKQVLEFKMAYKDSLAHGWHAEVYKNQKDPKEDDKYSWFKVFDQSWEDYHQASDLKDNQEKLFKAGKEVLDKFKVEGTAEQTKFLKTITEEHEKISTADFKKAINGIRVDPEGDITDEQLDKAIMYRTFYLDLIKANDEPLPANEIKLTDNDKDKMKEHSDVDLVKFKENIDELRKARTAHKDLLIKLKDSGNAIWILIGADDPPEELVDGAESKDIEEGRKAADIIKEKLETLGDNMKKLGEGLMAADNFVGYNAGGGFPISLNTPMQSTLLLWQAFVGENIDGVFGDFDNQGDYTNSHFLAYLLIMFCFFTTIIWSTLFFGVVLNVFGDLYAKYREENTSSILDVSRIGILTKLEEVLENAEEKQFQGDEESDDTSEELKDNLSASL